MRGYMTSLLFSLMLLTPGICNAGGGCDVTIPYGTAATIDFNLFELDGSDLQTGAVYASGDVKLMKDEGAEANVTTGFTDEGQSYSQPLSATEAEARRLVLLFVDQTGPKAWLDRVCTITTYGSKATAGASGTITLDTGESATDDIYNDTTAIEIIEGTGKGQSRCITDYNGTTKVASVTPNWTTNPASGSIYVLKSQPYCGGLKTDAIDSNTIASNALGSDEIAASAIGASELATDAIGAAELATDAIGSDELAADAIGASELAASAIGASELATDAIGAAEIATNAIGEAELAADAEALMGGGSGGAGALLVASGSVDILSVTGATTGSAVTSSTVQLPEHFKPGKIVLNGDYTSGSGATADVVVQHSPDGTNWFTLGTFDQVGTTDAVDEIDITTPVYRFVRTSRTIAGTLPIYTLEVSIWGEAE